MKLSSDDTGISSYDTGTVFVSVDPKKSVGYFFWSFGLIEIYDAANKRGCRSFKLVRDGRLVWA